MAVKENILLGIFLLLLLFPSFVFGAEVFGQVVRVTDGDTITLLTSEKKQLRIRFLGIDAPEKKQAFGQASKKHLASFVAGKEVKVSFDETDRYGRLLGIVFGPGGQNLNQIQIQAGYAWHYRQYSQDPILQALEDQARAKGVGLWADPRPVPPWLWRRQHR